jgi:acyl-CoA synthetase (AMP-forming)/AMP-acid ligase II
VTDIGLWTIATAEPERTAVIEPGGRAVSYAELAARADQCGRGLQAPRPRGLGPAVDDVAVFGIPHDEWGEEIKAVVQPAPGAEPGPALTTDLLAYLGERLARFMLPRTIDFVTELPRDPNGKLYKRRLRDPYWAGRDRAI